MDGFQDDDLPMGIELPDFAEILRSQQMGINVQITLNLATVIPTGDGQDANCTAGIGFDEPFQLLGGQVNGASLAITDLTTSQVVESLIPAGSIPPFERNQNTADGLARNDPLGLPHWSGFTAFGVTELQPRELQRNEAYSLVFELEFPREQPAEEFDIRLQDAIRQGPSTVFPLNIATGSGDADGNPFFDPDHGNRYAVCPLEGDTNFDCAVNVDDLNSVRNNFGATGPDNGSLAGDAVPFDGIVNIRDLNAVRNNFGAVPAAVPEPSAVSLALLVVCAAVITLNRRTKAA
jgi:hypothetical protein